MPAGCANPQPGMFLSRIDTVLLIYIPGAVSHDTFHDLDCQAAPASTLFLCHEMCCNPLFPRVI
jgi:hypothetical protein